MLAIQYNFTTRWAEITGDGGEGSRLTLINVSNIAGVVDQFGSSAAGALHGHNSFHNQFDKFIK